jgi:hypothetical protein
MLENKNLEKITKKTLKKSERKRKSRRKILALVLFVTLFFAIYGHFLYSFKSAFSFQVFSQSPLDEKVKKETESLLGLTYLYFFPNNSWLTPSLFPFERGLKARVPEIEEITVKRMLLSRSLDISYKLRTPVLRIPSGDVLDTHNMPYKDSRDLVLPLLVTDQKISKEDLLKLIFLKETIETALFPLDEVRVDKERDVTFILHTEAHSQILFSLSQSEKDVWSKIVSALDTSPLKENKETFSKVESLDARFGNKIYYKVKVEKGVPIPVSTATTTYERQ